MKVKQKNVNEMFLKNFATYIKIINTVNVQNSTVELMLYIIIFLYKENSRNLKMCNFRILKLRNERISSVFLFYNKCS